MRTTETERLETAIRATAEKCFGPYGAEEFMRRLVATGDYNDAIHALVCSAVSNPLADLAGAFAGNPAWEAAKEEMRSNRDELDALTDSYTWTRTEDRMPEPGTGPWLVERRGVLESLYAGASEWVDDGMQYVRSINGTRWCAVPMEPKE